MFDFRFESIRDLLLQYWWGQPILEANLMQVLERLLLSWVVWVRWVLKLFLQLLTLGLQFVPKCWDVILLRWLFNLHYVKRLAFPKFHLLWRLFNQIDHLEFLCNFHWMTVRLVSDGKLKIMLKILFFWDFQWQTGFVEVSELSVFKNGDAAS